MVDRAQLLCIRRNTFYIGYKGVSNFENDIMKVRKSKRGFSIPGNRGLRECTT